ncbi:hypothetical protein PAMP_019532 [Pampus punctatissimus]
MWTLLLGVTFGFLASSRSELLQEWVTGCWLEHVLCAYVWQSETADRHKGDTRSCSLCISYTFTHWEVRGGQLLCGLGLGPDKQGLCLYRV